MSIVKHLLLGCQEMPDIPPPKVKRHIDDINAERHALAEANIRKLHRYILRGYSHIALLEQFFPEHNRRTVRRWIDLLIERGKVDRHNRSYVLPRPIREQHWRARKGLL